MLNFSSLLGVAWRSLLYRFSGVVLTVVSVAISVFVLLGVEHVRQEARNGFASTISGVDLIVGARTGVGILTSSTLEQDLQIKNCGA